MKSKLTDSSSDCRFNCHRRCELLVPRDCPGERRPSHGEGERFPPDRTDAGGGGGGDVGLLAVRRQHVEPVAFTECTAAGPGRPADPEDNDSELTSTTTLEVSDDEMSTDGDRAPETKDEEEEEQREPMRSEGR